MKTAAHHELVSIRLDNRAHAKEEGSALAGYPAVFLRCAVSLTGSDAIVDRLRCSDKLESGAELAVTIGRTVVSVHGLPRQWTESTHFDRTKASGARSATPDERPCDAAGPRILSWVNGDVIQDGDAGDLIFDVATLITTVAPRFGNVIASGAAPSRGGARPQPVFLGEGHRNEIKIEAVSNAIAGRDGARP